MAYLLSNICTKNYWNRTTIVDIIVLRHSGHTVYRPARTWADAQRDGRPAEYSWRSLFNAAKFG